MKMPLYTCHKQVHALKIKAHVEESNQSVTLIFEDNRFDNKVMDLVWRGRFHPTPDDLGYLVEYTDGFSSWSPTKAFEEGYTAVHNPTEKE